MSRDAQVKKLRRRYLDAYAVAGTVNGIGGLGQVLGTIVIAGGIVLIFALKDSVGQKGAIGAGVATAILGLIVLVLGTVLAALAQMVRASLDTAVNTSPLLDVQEKLAALGLPSSEAPKVDGHYNEDY